LKILLVDVDSKIPNLALMKISTYHKNLKNNINIVKLGFDGYPTSKKEKIIDAKEYDKVYASCIFTVNKDYFKIINCDQIKIGGTGVDLSYSLPDYVDSLNEDYELYPENNNSYGFITRGCIRNCYFCFVPKKEGKLIEYKNWRDIVKHKKTYFLDNNFLAYGKHKEILKELSENNIHFQFNQGLDIRLIDDENARLLSETKYLGEFIFAFDDIKYEKMVENGLNIFKKYVSKDWKTKFFVYCHPNMPLQNIIYRIEWLKNHKALPYIMRDKDCWQNDNNEFYIDLAAYCNQPNIFKKMNWEEFLNKRHTNKDRILLSLDMWNKNI
jgi:hypothetical protein